MTTRELIAELEKQKTMLGSNLFDPELLEKYLSLTTTKQQNETTANKPNELNIAIHGIGSIEKINHKLNKIYPFQSAESKFIRARSEWSTLYIIARKTDKPVNISIKQTTKQYQKTPIPSRNLDKAA